MVVRLPNADRRGQLFHGFPEVQRHPRQRVGPLREPDRFIGGTARHDDHVELRDVLDARGLVREELREPFGIDGATSVASIEQQDDLPAGQFLQPAGQRVVEDRALPQRRFPRKCRVRLSEVVVEGRD